MDRKYLYERIISIILVIIMLFSFTSCGKGESKEENKDEIKYSKVDNSGGEYGFTSLIDNNPVKESKYKDKEKRSLYKINCNLDNTKKELDCNETISFVNTTGVDLNDIALNLYPEFYSEHGIYSYMTKQYVVDGKYADIVISKVSINNQDIDSHVIKKY